MTWVVPTRLSEPRHGLVWTEVGPDLDKAECSQQSAVVMAGEEVTPWVRGLVHSMCSRRDHWVGPAWNL